MSDQLSDNRLDQAHTPAGVEGRLQQVRQFPPQHTAITTWLRDEEARPRPSTATPGIIWPAFFPRPCTWQNIRSGLVRASGRSQLHTSAASRTRPSGQAGTGTDPTAQRSRVTSTAPAFTASYAAPCPRRCPGTNDSPASTRLSALAYRGGVAEHPTTRRRYRCCGTSTGRLGARASPDAAMARWLDRADKRKGTSALWRTSRTSWSTRTALR